MIGTSGATCAETGGNKSALIYKCAEETQTYNPNAPMSNTVRFQYDNSVSFSICEVTIYVNPGKIQYFLFNVKTVHS